MRITLVAICCLFVSAIAEPEVRDPGVPNVVQKWQKVQNTLKGLADEGVKRLLPSLMDGLGTLNISQTCVQDAIKILTGIKKIKAWALRFVDASAKSLDGLMTGAMSSFGAYDQCLDTQVIDQRYGKKKGKVHFTGKYCYIDLKPPLPPERPFYKLDEVLDELKNFSSQDTLTGVAAKNAHFFYFLSYRVGICVPSGCSREDVNYLAKTVSGYIGMSAYVPRCEVKEDKVITPLMVAIMTAFASVGFLMLIGTTVDLFFYYTKRTQKSLGLQLLMAFSFVSSFRKFVDTTTSSKELSCLNGVRFLSMSWVILGHTYLVVNYQLFSELRSVIPYAKDFAFQAVINASVAVDTFFFIGGLLVCYLTIKNCRISGRSFSVRFYILHRIWRVIPAYSFVIAFMFLTGLLGDGPIFHEMSDQYLQSCYENWWTNFIFINNFYHADRICVPQSWYTSCDMQLYVASLLILLPLLRWPKVGISLTVAFIVASMAASGLATYVNSYPPAMLFAHPDPKQRLSYWATFYFKPYVHGGPYCIGLLSGYLLATRPKLKMSKSVQISGWCVAFICCTSVLYGVLGWNRGADPTFWENMFYSSCHRTVWAVGVAWMVICCATGHGGVVNYILSWKAWIPLGRLSFIAYLIHCIVQVAAVGNVRNQFQPMHYFAVWIYCGHLMVTYGAAFAGSMLIEVPLLSIEKIFLSRMESQTQTCQNQTMYGKDTKAISCNGVVSSAKLNSQAVSLNGQDNTGFVSRL